MLVFGLFSHLLILTAFGVPVPMDEPHIVLPEELSGMLAKSRERAVRRSSRSILGPHSSSESASSSSFLLDSFSSQNEPETHVIIKPRPRRSSSRRNSGILSAVQVSSASENVNKDEERSTEAKKAPTFKDAANTARATHKFTSILELSRQFDQLLPDPENAFRIMRENLVRERELQAELSMKKRPEIETTIVGMSGNHSAKEKVLLEVPKVSPSPTETKQKSEVSNESENNEIQLGLDNILDRWNKKFGIEDEEQERIRQEVKRKVEEELKLMGFGSQDL